MKKIIISVFALLVVLPVVLPLRAQDVPVTTLIMVRHAEEDRSKEEIPLTDAGHRRARELERVLRAVKIDAVLSTSTARAKSTARPTAEAKTLAIQIYDYKDYGELPLVVSGILAKYKGKTVLIAGHSDDVPIMVNIVRKEFDQGKGMPKMAKVVYDNLYILVVPDKGPAKLLELKYGEPSPTG